MINIHTLIQIHLQQRQESVTFALKHKIHYQIQIFVLFAFNDGKVNENALPSSHITTNQRIDHFSLEVLFKWF